MSFTKKALVATSVLLTAMAIGQASAAGSIQFKVNSYTADSVTFTLTGTMPAVDPGTLFDGPNEIDINYSGNLFTGPQVPSLNFISGDPLNGDGGFFTGATGGFNGITPTNYSWMFFNNPLTGLSGSGTPVTLTWGGTDYLNVTGTGSFDLYWSNLTPGPDPSGVENVLLGSVDVVDGQITQVPEPATLALMGIGLAALALGRRTLRNARTRS